MVGVRLGDAGGDGPHAYLGNEFHGNDAVGFAHLRSKISCFRSSIE